MEISTVYIGYETVDEYGRLGSVVGVYRNSVDADIGVKGKGWYGGTGRWMQRKAFVNGDDIYILEDGKPMQFEDVSEKREAERKQIAENLMKKLSKEEIEILKTEFAKEGK